MAIQPSDLQPQQFKVTVKGKEYSAKPPRMAHRIILMKVQPMFEALSEYAEGKPIELDSEKLLEWQHDLDVVFNDLVPELKDVELDEVELMELIEQLIDNSLPQDSKDLKEAKVEVSGSPKEKQIG